jgi:hypothetical protein
MSEKRKQDAVDFTIKPKQATTADFTTARFVIVGTAPLLMHSDRLADPLDHHTIEIAKISSKRKKTIADHQLLSKLEFIGGMYWDEKLGPYAPAKWLDGGVVEGGKRERLGETIKRACRCVEDQIPIEYEGPRAMEALWDAGFWDRRPVGVKQNKTLRTRACFKLWRFPCTFIYDDSELEYEQIYRAVERLGRLYGIGDYTPRFGRFDIEEASR